MTRRAFLALRVKQQQGEFRSTKLVKNWGKWFSKMACRDGVPPRVRSNILLRRRAKAFVSRLDNPDFGEPDSSDLVTPSRQTT